MIFETYNIPGPFNRYLEAIFHFKNFVPDHSVERVVPTGHSFLIFELDGIPRNTFDNRSLKPNAVFTKVWVSGMHKHYISISAHQNSEMFVMQFKPYGARPFLHLPINELNNKVVSGETIFGDEIFQLRDRLIAAEGPEKKFEQSKLWLEQRYREEQAPKSEIIEIAEDLISQPAHPYGQIIQKYSKTQKHLISEFKKFCGLTPKMFHRILRFNEILAQVQKEEKISWPQIAYQCGFSDQSHFIKEFRAFSGFNPQEFIRHDFHKEEEANFFPLDKEG